MIQEDHAIAQLDALSRIMNVGALVLGPAAQLEFASPIACELLGTASLAELRGRWDGLKRPLLGDPRALPGSHVPARRVADFPLGGGERSLRVEIYRLGHAAAGYLVLVKDRRTVDMLETDLVLASQMRSLAHVYRVLAHDLRAPLNSMQLTVDLLADSFDPDPSPASQERRRRHLAILREELARLDRIVRTMLEQKEPLGSASGAFDLREVIQEIARLLLPQARRQRVETKLDLPADAVTVTGYRDRVKQALLNLAIRALEAMPDGGRLAIGCAVQGTAAVVTVEDNGSGLPAGLLDEIYQIHYTTRKSASGIGLYLARLVVESHGGDIGEEVLPEGTRFKLTLPLR
jgi:signal transduction histidine kinase